MSFSVLFVCTGNICRSPAAERLFRARLLGSADVVTSSAGTDGLPGWGIDGPCAEVLRELGIDTDGHVSRRVDDRILDDADLVLTATTVHRGILLRARPSMMATIFTMHEFVRLARGAPSPPADVGTGIPLMMQRVRAIADQRGVAEVPVAGSDEIPDPFGAPMTVVRDTIIDIAETVDAALLALGAQAGASDATGPAPTEPGRYRLAGSEPGGDRRK